MKMLTKKTIQEVIMQFYNSLCLRIDGGVKLEVEQLSDVVSVPSVVFTSLLYYSICIDNSQDIFL